MTTAVAVCLLMIFVAITGIFILWQRTENALYAYEPRHHARRAFADPADVTEPDGEQYIAELHHERAHPCISWRPPWDTSPGRGMAALRRRAAQELCAGRHRRAVHAADDTGQIMHAVGTWGMTAPELADQLAAEYLT